ncbi:hypothetical protein ACJJTC_013510 [Scirpophaga incertulas]
MHQHTMAECLLESMAISFLFCEREVYMKEDIRMDVEEYRIDKDFNLVARETGQKGPYTFRTSELVAFVAVSCTLFLFLHTRDLSTKLRRMQGRLNDDVTAFNHLTDSQYITTI